MSGEVSPCVCLFPRTSPPPTETPNSYSFPCKERKIDIGDTHEIKAQVNFLQACWRNCTVFVLVSLSINVIKYMQVIETYVAINKKKTGLTVPLVVFCVSIKDDVLTVFLENMVQNKSLAEF